MIKLMVLLSIIFSLQSFAEDLSTCNDRLLKRYLEYQNDLKQGRETAKHWDIKGMVKLMKKAGVTEKEYSVRVASYIYSYDGWQIDIERLISISAKCTNNDIVGVIEVFPLQSEVIGPYLFIRINSASKISDISFEKDLNIIGFSNQSMATIPANKQLIGKKTTIDRKPVKLI